MRAVACCSALILAFLALGFVGCRREFGQPPLIPQAMAEAVIRTLVPANEWKAFGRATDDEDSVSDSFYYGTTVSIINYENEVQLLVESPEAMRLRHKIMVGTDKRDWTLLRKETTYPHEAPFRRTYVFGSPDELRVEGLAFYEGAMLTLKGSKTLGAPERAAFEEYVVRASDRLALVYEASLKTYADGPMLDHLPPDRPDLPDPDLTQLGSNPCDGIRGSIFRSVEAFDSGMGPDGKAAMAPLTVEFRDGVVRFQVTDTVLTAAYVCADGDISGRSASGEFRGHYDAAKGTLTWNGHEYERVK